jgi:hypothetical protein
MHLLMTSYSRGSAVLAGSVDGQKVFAQLASATSATTRQSPAELCFLDFAGIDVATASFLRESIVAYRNHARKTWPRIYPVAANMSARVLEELETLLVSTSDAYVVCELDRNQKVQQPLLIGHLDGKQLVALSAVLQLGETDAPTLARNVDERVAPTAWNNRLGALADKGILIEATSGRNKRYRPVLEGLAHGT